MFGIYARNTLAGQGRYDPDDPTPHSEMVENAMKSEYQAETFYSYLRYKRNRDEIIKDIRKTRPNWPNYQVEEYTDRYLKIQRQKEKENA